jgi:hypothetical protein
MAQHDEVGKSAAGINPDLEHSGNEHTTKRHGGKGTPGKLCRTRVTDDARPHLLCRVSDLNCLAGLMTRNYLGKHTIPAPDSARHALPGANDERACP